MGYFGTNVGDNVALFNLRPYIQEHVHEEIEWSELNLKNLKMTKENSNIQKIISFFEKINEEYDVLLIGGAGLVEGWKYNNNITSWKLPFNEEVLNVISIPMIVFGIGLNFWRGKEKLNNEGKKNLRLLIEKSNIFSVRNDGSYEELINLVNPSKKIYEILDAGAVYEKENIKKNNVTEGYFNASDNCDKTWETKNINIKKLFNVIEKYQLKSYTHTAKTYNKRFKKLKFFIKKEKFCEYLEKDFNKLVDLYNNFDYVVPMHGHGQLIAYGKNIPYISIAGQEKMSELDKKLGLEDYCVDTKKNNCEKILDEKINKLLKDKEYLNNWYKIRNDKYGKLKEEFISFCKEVGDIINNK